jgi:transposase InsO family protein
LGIEVEWITPGHPEQNGVHERMHRTLKQETASPPAANRRAQQQRFDQWRQQFNRERPHEALGMQVPAALSAFAAPLPQAVARAELSSGVCPAARAQQRPD